MQSRHIKTLFKTTANEDRAAQQRSLSWSCVCSVNGLSPNVTEYSLTIPYFICTETNNQCKKNCGNGDGSCAHQCEYVPLHGLLSMPAKANLRYRVSNLCGARNPTRVNTSTISSTMSSTASNSKPTGGDDDYSSFGSGGSGSSGSNNGGDGGENGGGVDGTGAASGLKVDGSMAGMAALVAAVGLGFGALL